MENDFERKIKHAVILSIIKAAGLDAEVIDQFAEAVARVTTHTTQAVLDAVEALTNAMQQILCPQAEQIADLMAMLEECAEDGADSPPSWLARRWRAERRRAEYEAGRVAIRHHMAQNALLKRRQYKPP